MIFREAEINTQVSASGSFFPSLFPTLGVKTPTGPKNHPVKSHCLRRVAHSSALSRRTTVSKSARGPQSRKSLNQVLQPSLALLKYFGGDVSTLVANALVALLPQTTLVPTEGRGIQTEWEIGRSWEKNYICSDPKPQRQNRWAPFTFLR